MSIWSVLRRPVTPRMALGILVGCGIALLALWAFRFPVIRYDRQFTDYRHWFPTRWYVDDLASPDVELRAKAARALQGRTRTEDVSGYLAPLLADGDLRVRSAALLGLMQARQVHGALAGIPGPELLAAAQRMAANDPEDVVRRRAWAFAWSLEKTISGEAPTRSSG